VAFKHTVQFQVSIERHQNLVPEHTLIVKVESCESQAKDFCALGRRRDQLEGKTASKAPNLVEKHTRVALISMYAVLGQGWFYHYFEFLQRARGYEETMPEIGSHVWRMIDEVVRASRLSAVIEELDPHIAINSDDPIAYLVHVVDERAVLCIK
jgi:hypothetical protein